MTALLCGTVTQSKGRPNYGPSCPDCVVSYLTATGIFFLNLRRLTSIMGRWEWGREVAHTSNQPATPDMITPLKFITRKAAL